MPGKVGAKGKMPPHGPPPTPPVTTSDPKPEIFRAFRSKFNLTQTEAANFFGVSDAGWGAWERGKRPQAAARLLATLLVAKPELIGFFLEEETG